MTPNDAPSTPPEPSTSNGSPSSPGGSTAQVRVSPPQGPDAKTWVPLFVTRPPNSPLITATVLPPTPRREGFNYSPTGSSASAGSSAASDSDEDLELHPWGSRRGTAVSTGHDPRAGSPTNEGGPTQRGWGGGVAGKTSGVEQFAARGHVRKRSSQSVVTAMPGLGVAIPGASSGMERLQSLTTFMTGAPPPSLLGEKSSGGGYATMDPRRPSHTSKYNKQLADEKAMIWSLVLRGVVATLFLILGISCINLVFSYGFLPPSTTDIGLPPSWLDNVLPTSLHNALNLIETVPYSRKTHPRTPHATDDSSLTAYLTTRLGSHFSVPLSHTPSHLWLTPASNASIRITTPHLVAFVSELDRAADARNLPLLAEDSFEKRSLSLVHIARSIISPSSVVTERKRKRGDLLAPRRALVVLCLDDGCMEYCRKNADWYCFGGFQVAHLEGERKRKAREMVKMMAATEVLTSGRRVFVADGDVYFRDDPIASMGDLDDFDIQIPDSWSTSHTKAGFVFLNPTANVISLWERLLDLARIDDDRESRSWATTNLLLDPAGLNRDLDPSSRHPINPKASGGSSTEEDDEADDIVASGYGQAEFESPWAGGMDVKVLDRKLYRTSTGKLDGHAFTRARESEAIYFQCQCCEDLATTDYIAGALGYHHPSIAFVSPRSQGGVPHFPMMLTTSSLNGTAEDLSYSLGLILQVAHDTARSFIPPLDGRLVSSPSALSTRSSSSIAPPVNFQERYIWRLFPAARWARSGSRSYRTAAGSHVLDVDVLEPLYVQHALAHLATAHRGSDIAKASSKDLRDTLFIDPAHFLTYKQFLQTMIRPFYSTTRVVVFENIDSARGRKGWDLRAEFMDIELCAGDVEAVEGKCGVMCAMKPVSEDHLE
ncbi:hypothetical protein RQP46_008853 [Phenoliferia psychrophenolica]